MSASLSNNPHHPLYVNDPAQGKVMSQMDDEKWAALLENSLTRKEEQKVQIINDDDLHQHCKDERGGD